MKWMISFRKWKQQVLWVSIDSFRASENEFDLFCSKSFVLTDWNQGCCIFHREICANLKCQGFEKCFRHQRFPCWEHCIHNAPERKEFRSKMVAFEVLFLGSVGNRVKHCSRPVLASKYRYPKPLRWSCFTLVCLYTSSCNKCCRKQLLM